MPADVAANAAATDTAPVDSGDFNLNDIDSYFSEEETPAETEDAVPEDAPADVDEPVDDGPSEPEAAEEQPLEEAKPEDDPAKPAEVAKTDELPEGVSVRDRNGKKEFVLRDGRYQQFHEAYKLRREAEQVLGGPVTLDTITRHANLAGDWDQMHLDFLSGDPNSQRAVVGHLFANAKEKLQAGHISADPIPGFVDALFTEIRSKNEHARAYQELVRKSAADLLEDLYQEASQNLGHPDEATRKQAENMLRSAQHIDKRLFGKYKAQDQITVAQDPLAEREARLSQRERALTDQDARARQADWTAWQNNQRASTDASIHTAIDTALKEEVGGVLGKFPKTLANIREQLRTAVYNEINGNTNLQRMIAVETRRAQMAPNQELRSRIASVIVSRIQQRAQDVIAERKPEILREHHELLKAQSAATHQRRTQSQVHKAPASGGAPVKTSVVPMPSSDDGNFDIDAETNKIMGKWNRA